MEGSLAPEDAPTETSHPTKEGRPADVPAEPGRTSLDGSRQAEAPKGL